MSFNDYYHRTIKQLTCAEEIGLKKAIRFELSPDNSVKYVWDPRGLSEQSIMVLTNMIGNPSQMLEYYVYSRVVAEGPKIFQPSQFDLEMLINMDVNVPMSEYVQPFETCIIELPTDFRKNRIVASPQAGKIDANGNVVPAVQEPMFVILHHLRDLNTIVTTMMFNNDMSMKNGFTVPPDSLIEDQLKLHWDSEAYEDSLEISKEEQHLYTEMIRGCINYMFLIDEVGCNRRGPTNPGYETRLQKQLSKGGEYKKRAQRELRQLPIFYEIKRKVKLFTTTHSSEHQSDTGRVQSPHIRRGHYRMVPCGPNRSESRRVRIASVFVNADKFGGKMKDIITTYEGKDHVHKDTVVGQSGRSERVAITQSMH